MSTASRKPFHLTCLLLLAVPLAACTAERVERPTVVMYKNAGCTCCNKWAEHLNAAGYKVEVNEAADLYATRNALGIRDEFASCHTAKIGGILVEGHVPLADIERLLAEQANPQTARADVVGLAAPGMPQGSPGMESEQPEAYDTLLIHRDGSSEVYQHHPAPAAGGR
ncbi:MAG: DUF411 domain-containing protein [Azoarcus sp.]|jgi:hypothetical protein|nr:DUF411 domain-containing protein [Azoarcus sp.]